MARARAVLVLLVAFACTRRTEPVADTRPVQTSTAGMTEERALLTKIAAAQESYELETFYRSSRDFLAKYPKHAETDRVRWDLAMQLVSESLLEPNGAQADEARKLLEEHTRVAASEEQRFDAALVRLKFSHAGERQRWIDDIFHRFPKSPDLVQVYYWLVETDLSEGDTLAAAKHAKELLDRFDDVENEPLYKDVIARASMLGAPIPLDAKEKKKLGAQISGRVVLFDFWASWCQPCIAEVPRLREFWEKNRGRGFELVGVNVDHNESAFARYTENLGMKWPMLRSPEASGGLADRCRITTLPTYVVVGRDGRVRSIDVRGDALYALIEKLIAER
jgi:thiol-disulfide isomerase/thioredoxin